MAAESHPHFTAPRPPEGWLRPGDERRNLPRPLPSLSLGDATFVDSHFAEITIERALRHFFTDGDFPAASTDFDGGGETDYGHLFIRDAAYSLMLLQDTDWPERIGRPDMVGGFLKRAYGYQGRNDVPNVRNVGTPREWVANDGEKPGRLPHEIWPTWEANANARYLNEVMGWQWPVYFGAVDTTPLVAMMTARHVKAQPDFVSELVRQTNNDGTTRTTTVLRAWVAGVRHIINESRVTDENPEGLYETAAMSNLCWGDWDDSYDIIRDRNGDVATGTVTHVQLLAFARSAVLGLVEYLDQNADKAAMRAAGVGDAFLFEARSTADRLGKALVDHMLVRGDRQYGDYFVLGVDRDPQTGALRKLDVCTAKPALMLLVDPDHLPEGVAEIVVRQTLDPQNGLLFDNGIANLSVGDRFFNDDGYHHIVWPDKVGLIALGLEKHGYPALANEINERNWRNFDDAYVRGFHEFLRAVDGRALPVQRDVMAEVVGSDPKWEFKFVKHAMGGQLWALAAAARWQDRQALVWSGRAPHRAADDARAELESSIIAAIEDDRGLLTAALYHQDDLNYFEAMTARERIALSDGREIPISRFTPGAVELQGQRMPGEQSKGRGVTDGFGL